MALAAVSLEGVLRSPVGGALIPEGFNLYQGLASMYRVAVVLGDDHAAEASLWLRSAGVRDYSHTHPRHPLDDQRAQYQRLMAFGPVDLVVTADPDGAACAMELGLTTLLFAHPRTARPEWRPDFERTPRPWDELAGRVREARLLEPGSE